MCHMNHVMVGILASIHDCFCSFRVSRYKHIMFCLQTYHVLSWLLMFDILTMDKILLHLVRYLYITANFMTHENMIIIKLNNDRSRS